MPLPSDVSRCDGVRVGQPGADLCRACRRTEPGADDWQPFITPAVVVEIVAGNAYAECPNFIGPAHAVHARG